MMAVNEVVPSDNQSEISIKDIVEFIRDFYKKIIVVGLIGAIVGLAVSIIFGLYTATITLYNYDGLDIPRIRYLQSALPKLEQEHQQKLKNLDDSFLGSEAFWSKSIKPNILVSKADSKDLLDATALNAAGSKISSIQINSKGTTQEDAEKRVEKTSKFFIDGSTYIELRDLVRGYELKAITIDSGLRKKISSAEVELDYLQKRIKNLNDLKGQFPATTTTLGQVVDAKDSGAKYLPITTQIVAATTDVNNLKESLARYRDEESQNIVYKQFVKQAIPLVENNQGEADLGAKLLNVTGQIEKEIRNNIQLIAVEEIKVSLSAIQTKKLYGLKQAGVIDIENPPHKKYLGMGLLIGLFAGLLLAFALKLTQQGKSA